MMNENDLLRPGSHRGESFLDRATPSFRGHLLIFLLVLPSILAGCYVVPVPAFFSDATSGQRIYHSQIKTIEPGRTTRADIGTILGDPTFDDERAVAYVWEKPTTHIVWGWAIPVPVWLWGIPASEAPAIGDGGVETIGKVFVFFILYDDTGRVVTFERKRLSENQDPRNEFHRWIELTQP